MQFARSNIWVCFAFVLVLRGERCIDCYILAKWVWSSFLLRLQGLLALTTITPHETKCCPEKSEANATNLMTYSFFIAATQAPFRIEFQSDNYEFSSGAAAMNEGEGGNPGFKVRYFQTTC